MESITVYRIFSLSVFSLFFLSLFIPIAQISIKAADPDADLYLEFVCVFCQYGNVDSSAGETLVLLRFTPFDFYYTWVILIGLVGLSSISLFKGFPRLGLADKISDRLAVNSLWVLTVLGLLTRALLSFLLDKKIELYQNRYPNNQVLGELSWSMGAIIIGSLLAASTAMIGFIEFIYDPDLESTDEVDNPLKS